jgi:FlgD Ig-like domain
MGRHAATAVVLALLIGTAIAFAETERLKLKPTPIEESYVQPAFSKRAEIRLRLHRADTVTVRIQDVAGETVRVLAQNRRLPEGRTELFWDGRDQDGSQAPDGRYRVEVDLNDADRTFRLPQLTTLDTVAPTARVLAYRPEVANVRQRVRVFYLLSEQAHAILYVNGNRTVGPTYTKARRAQLQWRPQRAGRFRLHLAAVDPAGNLGPHSPVFIVRVR